MSENNVKMDIRYVKTEKALDHAMYSLLEKRNFQKITVSDICAAAMISRASFYVHYIDKYDFLQDWLSRLYPQNLTFHEPYDYIETSINQFVLTHKSIIKNIVMNADNETLDILLKFILLFLKITPKSDKVSSDPAHIVSYNIYAGGLIRYIIWQVENNFPKEVLPMNIHIYKIIEKWYKMKTE